MPCFEGQRPTLGGGCVDAPSMCVIAHPENGASATYTVNPVSHLCELNTTTAVVVACPIGYSQLCGKSSCICISDATGGTSGAGNISLSVNNAQSRGGLPCRNAAECFFTDQLPYALGVLGGCILLLSIIIWFTRRCCGCPTFQGLHCCCKPSHAPQPTSPINSQSPTQRRARKNRKPLKIARYTHVQGAIQGAGGGMERRTNPVEDALRRMVLSTRA